MPPASSLVSALVGGSVLGLSATLLWVVNGRTAGVSGIIGGVVRPRRGEVGWQAAFLLGLLLSGLIGFALRPAAFGTPELSAAGLVVAGLLVGAGTRLGSGCTSGHGVCGISRGSRRSLVATMVFMLSAVITVALSRLLRGAA